jgi:hypothetical protein
VKIRREARKKGRKDGIGRRWEIGGESVVVIDLKRHDNEPDFFNFLNKLVQHIFFIQPFKPFRF